MSRYAEKMAKQLPTDGTSLEKVMGWFSWNREMEVYGWIVNGPHCTYGHASDRITRAEGVGKTAQEAINNYYARIEECLPAGWTLSKEHGHFPWADGEEEVDGWIVESTKYGHPRYRISVAEGVGRTAAQAVRDFYKKNPDVPYGRN